jgi:hypothetical protein
VRKIYQINSVQVYSRTGVFSTLGYRAYTYRPQQRPWDRTHCEWISAALTPAQLRFIERQVVTFRPHPRHSPTVELFIYDADLTERDWCVIGLLF